MKMEYKKFQKSSTKLQINFNYQNSNAPNKRISWVNNVSKENIN